MSINKLLLRATNKDNFVSLNQYIDFCNLYLDYIESNLQAVIVSQNENHYRFFQYNSDANFQITRPINSSLMYDINTFSSEASEFRRVLQNIKAIDKSNVRYRTLLNKSIYTIQQSIGSTLDGLPAGKSNTARKLNGDLFEQFIRLLIQEIGVNCSSGTIQVPVTINNAIAFNMSYQHDLIIEKDSRVRVIGSVKTSSKDRIDKIFIDKFLYNKLTGINTPHVAIFLNDVQRKNTRRINEYGINSTFLPGHFKGYTIKLNPLDGVFYCDIRPNMLTDEILKSHISTLDKFFIDEIWKFL